MARKLSRLPKIVTKLYEDEFYHQPGTVPGTIFIDADAPPPIIS
ncbi:magnesium and cobalt transport protein CorA, partial [Nostoc sp. HG1]|nr:magnesium and cobalt transport protein CorA [Nostoc sp. HG1]MBC6435803.1 magnesium and cobalt transport protein CorA [Nostoc sp. HG1]MBC6435808.1 magnesium and cobalt transport protein CorA [Nostoc sp. HG1]